MTSLLANHLWQSTFFAIVAALLTLLLRKNHARTRHSIWLAASIKFLVPFLLLISAGSHVQWPHSAAPTPQVSRAVSQIGQPFQASSQFIATPASEPAAFLPIMACVVWLCGFTGILFFWCVRWRRIRAMVRTASPADSGALVRTMSTPALLEPGVFGIFRPVLLLPEGICERLTPQQLQAVVAHELCHVRRRDNLAAAIHMVVESVFWFHPLVWWIGSRLVDERERACDEEVLRQGSAPEIYAEGILNVCRFYVGSPLTCVSGVTGSDLKKRIEAIMTHGFVRSMGFGRKLILATVCIFAVMLPVAIGILNAQSPATRPQFEVASVKPNTSGANNALARSDSPGTFNGDNYPLLGLIARAYGVQPFQITGAPRWIETSRYDIAAKSNVNPVKRPRTRGALEKEKAEMKLMLQSLLEERFQLRLHRETKELPVYALTIAKGGLKLHGACTADFNTPLPPSARPDFCDKLNMGGSGPRQTLNASGITMTDFLDVLSDYTEHIVIDKTGFTGKFDAHLEFMSDNAAQDDNSVPSLFTAMEEQLGLKVESTKGPAEILVIDHVERPSEN